MGEFTGGLELVDTMDVQTLMVLCVLGFWRIIKALHAIELRMAVQDQHRETLVSILDKHVEQDEHALTSLNKSLAKLADRVNQNAIESAQQYRVVQ